MKKVNNLQEAKTEMYKDMEKLFVGTMLEVSKKVIVDTPEDTGNAKGNWQGSIGQPITTTINSVVAVGRRENPESTLGQWKIGQVGYFSNPTTYIEPLEYGWSNQAPSGMVRINVGSAQAVLDRQVQKIQSGG